jgi:hypothetical protein
MGKMVVKNIFLNNIKKYIMNWLECQRKHFVMIKISLSWNGELKMQNKINSILETNVLMKRPGMKKEIEKWQWKNKFEMTDENANKT